MIFNCCLLQARSLKQLHEVPLGLMRRADFIEIVCELVFPLKPNHQLSHFSQEIDGFRVCFVILPVQRGLDRMASKRPKSVSEDMTIRSS